MKSICLLLCLAMSMMLLAQNTEGIIYYKESIKLDIDLPKDQEHLRALIPATSDQSKALYFTKDLSIYKDISAADDVKEINHTSGDAQMQIKIASGSAENRLLKNFADQRMLDQREFLGKTFLIDGIIPEMKWKITGEQKKILDFTCMKATQLKDSMEIVAWFTPQIPLPNGPETYGQLPGLILEVTMEEGKRTITATEVALGAFDERVLTTPKKGKKVTREEFTKIKEDKLKEMGSTNGRTIIRMEVDDRG